MRLSECDAELHAGAWGESEPILELAYLGVEVADVAQGRIEDRLALVALRHPARLDRGAEGALSFVDQREQAAQRRQVGR